MDIFENYFKKQIIYLLQKNKIKSDIMNECKSSFNSIRSVNKWI